MAQTLTVGIEDLENVTHAAASPRLLAAGIDTHVRPSGDFWIKLRTSGLGGAHTFDVSIECSHGGIAYGAGSATTLAKAIDDAIAEAEIRIREMRARWPRKGGRDD